MTKIIQLNDPIADLRGTFIKMSEYEKLEAEIEQLKAERDRWKAVVKMMDRNYRKTGKPYMEKDGELILEIRSLDAKEDWPPSVQQPKDQGDE